MSPLIRALKIKFHQGRGGQLFSSAGHIALLLVSRRPHFSQKGKVKAKQISPRGPDVARGPYVAPPASRGPFHQYWQIA